MQKHVTRWRHLAASHFPAQFRANLHLLIPRARTPAGKIHMSAGLIYVTLDKPRGGRDITIPRPLGTFGVAILTGTLKHTGDLAGRFCARKQRFTGTLSLDLPEWMNRGAGDTQQTYG